MSAPDLTPKTYLNRTRVQLALRHWVLGVGACALAAAGVISIEATSPPDADASRAQERLTLAQARATQSKDSVKSLARQLRQYERELQAEQHLTKRPDWSAVLNLVAGQFDEQSVMTGFQLGEANDPKVRSALGPLGRDVGEGSAWLIITGVAESNSTVPGLILRLESLGLFKRVVMTGTQREAFAGGPRIGFTLACQVE